ncbi:DNA-binding transcriptional regulator, MerR family [Tangfeifania diversioriginum]|uniref:DNA-binding transcriptional regulator, MerR family n=1 Tax=Tangfeifania diversioriginum TaxID=1168035 RepID=A0A1M6PBN1_9BACT|nr:MerR family transcriptional regulator [Tangfeifania diversioriginum]SHK05282.1 DNA-binding transcriptional regulator, MerR family [Tangfeifania diversioriginum]
MKEAGYSIKDLEVLSGIKAHTIRIWEKRYNLLIPKRTDTNIRYYSDADLRKMLNVSMLVRNGFKISKVARMGENQLSENILSLTAQKASESDYIDRLILHMVNFDNKGFYNLASEIIGDKGLEDAVSKIFFDFFVRVGIFWQVGSIFPAQEHYVSGIFRQKLIAEIDKLGIDNTRNSTILFFLPEGELHEMSLLFYSYLARKMGYNVIYLGQFVPFQDLSKIQEHVKIDFVFTAFINSVLKEDLENYLEQLKGLFTDQKIFITGWQLQLHQPGLPRNVKIVKDYHEFKKFFR